MLLLYAPSWKDTSFPTFLTIRKDGDIHLPAHMAYLFSILSTIRKGGDIYSDLSYTEQQEPIALQNTNQ